MNELLGKWREAWPAALELWSRYTRLSEPLWCCTRDQEKEHRLSGSFALIRLVDHRILISLRQIEELGLQEYALEILAHEIGHHVYTPGDLLDAAIALARTRLGLPGQEARAPDILNLYEDLLINDRLVRFHSLRIADIYKILAAQSKGQPGALWSLYMGAYEILWGLERCSLGGEKLEGAAEGDAQLVARLVRVYGNDWVGGAGGFAALCLPYLMKDGARNDGRFVALLDATAVGAGGAVPMGLVEMGEGPILHPSMDPNVVGSASATSDEGEELTGPDNLNAASEIQGGGTGQCREPFQYGEILKALGLDLSQHDAAVMYYRERALPHLVPFPTRPVPESQEPLMEGLESWDIGSPLEDVDWLQTVMLSPQVFPGLTTVQRSWGKMSGKQSDPEPLDLDLYVDCSGSIPNPQLQMSYITLAGAIVVLSALRAGSRVQATLWSGHRQFDTTGEFVRDETQIMRVLTGYLGGGTAFPNHIVRTTYEKRTERDRPVHLLVLSDEGIDTMGAQDEKGNPGLEVSRMALEKARGGATMVLNLYSEKTLELPFYDRVRELGWSVFRVSDWAGLVDFAREFARLKYGPKSLQS